MVIGFVSFPETVPLGALSTCVSTAVVLGGDGGGGAGRKWIGLPVH